MKIVYLVWIDKIISNLGNSSGYRWYKSSGYIVMPSKILAKFLDGGCTGNSAASFSKLKEQVVNDLIMSLKSVNSLNLQIQIITIPAMFSDLNLCDQELITKTYKALNSEELEVLTLEAAKVIQEL